MGRPLSETSARDFMNVVKTCHRSAILMYSTQELIKVSLLNLSFVGTQNFRGVPKIYADGWMMVDGHTSYTPRLQQFPLLATQTDSL